MEQLYIGVDLHSRFFQACAVDRFSGAAALGGPVRVHDGSGFEPVSRRGVSGADAVAVEASGADVALRRHHPRRSVGRVVVVDAFRTRLKAGFAAKTDRLDARRLADALRRESVVGIYVPPSARAGTPRVVPASTDPGPHQARPRSNGCGRCCCARAWSKPRGCERRSTSRRWRSRALPPRAGEAVAQLRTLLVQVHEQVVIARWQPCAGSRAAMPVTQALMTMRAGSARCCGLTIRSEVGLHRAVARARRTRRRTPSLVPRVDASAGRRALTAGLRVAGHRGSAGRWSKPLSTASRPTDRRGAWGRRLGVRKGALKARVAMARRLCEEIVMVWRRIGRRPLQGGGSGFS